MIDPQSSKAIVVLDNITAYSKDNDENMVLCIGDVHTISG
jgi:hypothetical protein